MQQMSEEKMENKKMPLECSRWVKRKWKIKRCHQNNLTMVYLFHFLCFHLSHFFFFLFFFFLSFCLTSLHCNKLLSLGPLNGLFLTWTWLCSPFNCVYNARCVVFVSAPFSSHYGEWDWGGGGGARRGRGFSYSLYLLLLPFELFNDYS